MTATTVVPAAAKSKSLVTFIGEVKQELKRIDWTAKEELRFYTKVVAGSTFVFGMAIYLMDLVIQGALHLIGLLAR